MPVDSAPTPDGNIELIPKGPGTVRAEVRPADHPWVEHLPRFTSHFVTCPQAGEHRRR